jgi:hypothetical protein
MDVDITFDEAYLRVDRNDVRKIDNSLGSKISADNSIQDPKLKWINLFYPRIKNHCKIFNSFALVKTLMMVAHGHVVSLFSVLKQKWIKHIAFDHEIKQIFRQRDKHGDFEIGVLLNNGEIQSINH